MTRKQLVFGVFVDFVPFLMAALTVSIQVIDVAGVFSEHLTNLQITGAIGILGLLTATSFAVRYKFVKSKIVMATAILWVISTIIYSIKFISLLALSMQDKAPHTRGSFFGKNISAKLHFNNPAATANN